MGEEKSRGLFTIKAVNKETDAVVYSSEVVAEGEKEALFESDLKDKLKEQHLTKNDVYILVKEFGVLPAKEQVKHVKIIGQFGKHLLAKEDCI